MVEEKEQFLFKTPQQFKIKNVIKRDGRIVAFNRGKIANSIFRAAVDVGGSDRALSEELADKVVKIISEVYPIGATPSVEEIQDLIEKVLVETGHYKTVKAYILYRAEHSRLREEKEERIASEDDVPYKILWKVFTWNVDHSCDTTQNLNKIIKGRKFPDLVKEAEKTYHDEIKNAVRF